MTEAIIQLEKVTKKYDDQVAVNQLTLQISKGEIFGLLGPNGAGKTTTILMMLGLSEPTEGSIKVCGIDPVRNPISVKRKVGYLPDNVGFYQNMTGLENLMYTGQLNQLTREEALARAESILEKVGLYDERNKKAGKYSRGMKQRLGLADVLMKNPEVIILDEPTLGIDPEGVRDLLNLIENLSKEEQITVLLSSHHLHQVQQICDRVGIFVKGELIAEGDIQTLAKKLFSKEWRVITLKVNEMNERLIQELKKIKGVTDIKQIGERLEISCDKDVTATISQVVVEAGCYIIHLSQKDYGLDEIYHRYFEGRDVVESR